jgi:NAD(P)-dependent dehydrogenase (short-subunit alcohol dehydrogenase family)
MQHNFAGKVIIVTGGSSGIGKATADYFVQQGGSVLITGRRAEALKAAANHERIAWIAADIGQEEAASAIVARALELWGHLDILVNNAGISYQAPLESIETEQMYRLFQTNVFGPTWLSKAALPALSQSRGAIVNVTSASGQLASVRGSGAQSAYYAASKAALELLTRYWAVDLAPRGIRVNAIAPGPTATPALESFLKNVVRQGSPTASASVRYGTPEDIVAWIAAVADPANKWLTGQVITVDGGIQLGARLD